MQSCRISVFVATLLMLGAGACTTEGEPDPGTNAIGQDYYGNAGCLVKHDRQMLVVRLRSTGRLDNPGGTHESGETARSTARRETWEEAGLEVEVGSSDSTSMQFVAFTIGTRSVVTVFPVIGPPMMS